MADIALERGFPVRREAVIDPEIGCEQRSLGFVPLIFDRAELDRLLVAVRAGSNEPAAIWVFRPAS